MPETQQTCSKPLGLICLTGSRARYSVGLLIVSDWFGGAYVDKLQDWLQAASDAAGSLYSTLSAVQANGLCEVGSLLLKMVRYEFSRYEYYRFLHFIRPDLQEEPSTWLSVAVVQQATAIAEWTACNCENVVGLPW